MDIKSYISAKEKLLGRDLRLGFFGLGRSNLSLIASLPKKYKQGYILRSEDLPKHDVPKKEARLLFGTHAFDDACEDVLFLSPSVRRDRQEFSPFVKHGTQMLSDAELFFLDNPKNVFAISGSDGKSTTTHLSSMLLEDEYTRSIPCGNYGTPFSSVEYRLDAAYVAELSSFNLQYMRPKTYRSLITNITPNHLNWHSSYEEYREAKLSLMKGTEGAVLCADDPECAKALYGVPLYSVYSTRFSYKELRQKYSADCYITLSEGKVLANLEPILRTEQMYRTEKYSLLNMLGAIALCHGHTSKEKIVSTAQSFRGLRHRCELVLEHKGVRYINSSIDTTPERTAATLAEVRSPVKILLGGRAKGLPLSPLTEALARKAAKIAIYGEAAEEFYTCIKEDERLRTVKTECFDKFREALDYLLHEVCEGDTVILSPAATGYGEFTDFAERGDCFCQYIREYFGK